VLEKGLGALDDPRWRVDVGEATWIQASTSPVWDTVLTLLAFDDCDLNERQEKEVEKALDWVLAQQVLRPGDWKVKCPKLEPGGWAFEYKNYFYPDTDDTAVTLIALAPFRNKRKISSPVHGGDVRVADGGGSDSSCLRSRLGALTRLAGNSYVQGA